MRRERAGKGRTPSSHRHSDKERFCSDLKGPKISQMSEQPIKRPRISETSKMNTVSVLGLVTGADIGCSYLGTIGRQCF